MRYYSLNHDYAGRRKKKRKAKGEVYAKYTPPPFKPLASTASPSYADIRMAEAKRYESRENFSVAVGARTETQKYTGDYVIGIATMHKSNAVPVTNPKHATEISQMRR